MFRKRSKKVCILYTIFAVYIIVVLFFLLSMVLRSAMNNSLKAEGMPRYMNDEDIKKVQIHPDGPLNQQIKTAFKKVDSNENNFIEEDELSDWIQSKVSEHITVAVKNNYKVFLKLDKTPKDGWISSSEYEAYFLSQRGLSSLSELEGSMREQLMSEQDEFEEISNESDQLTIDELLRFLHPESSHARLLEQVNELVETLDDDGDLGLSKSELLVLASDGYQPSEIEAVFPVKSKSELGALHARLDINSDGRLDQQELLVFYDPRHSHHAQRDSKRLLELADTDRDGKLSLSEVQLHPEQFKLIVDARTKFHQPDDLR